MTSSRILLTVLQTKVIQFFFGKIIGQELLSKISTHSCSFTRKQKCSIRFFLDQELNRIFTLPLSTQAAAQLEEVQVLLWLRSWDENIDDKWCYSWGSSTFRSKKVYKLLIGHTPCSPLFTWLWASNNLGKHKFFFWLLLRDRLNTRNLLRRKNMILDDYNCVLCNPGCEETSFHLFFECTFSQDCWSSIPIAWNTNLQPLDMIIEARTVFGYVLFRESSSLPVGSSGQQEMPSSLIMDKPTYPTGKESSKRNLALRAQRPSQVGRQHLEFGEIAIASFYLLFCFWALLPCTCLFFVSFLLCTEHSFI